MEMEMDIYWQQGYMQAQVMPGNAIEREEAGR